MGTNELMKATIAAPREQGRWPALDYARAVSVELAEVRAEW
jgi:hypothetical protein